MFNAFKTFGRNLTVDTYKHFRSVFFEYRHSRHTIRIKNNFDSRSVTTQFKRGLYEVFLQKYHVLTGKGNNPMFDAVRSYARYGYGHLHVFYAYNNIIFEPKETDLLKLPMSSSILDNMMSSGIFEFWLSGHMFFLEVLPVAFESRGQAYLQRAAQKILIPAKGNERIFEFTDISQIDIFMQRLYS